ncbi:MAG: hypothetical protein UW79_C0013G0006 [Candidatus Yanofskybacteria bacterium GW2011_GWA2_44_9]|uniref:Uncharacterized protein n=1 Tax=Candidatus Yanofskybacteria bacterium GW2011_GWA2_44_9 TaxID=1619025 RepID=A0A0G1NCE8_9BACT|nr:MAG: hypothetical protein UW79_C0013G0006 [Candidatus Yanofskybacteria bacterium GW2011_GWA2_44_9]
MELTFRLVKAIYFPMPWRTLSVLVIVGLGVALYTHELDFLISAILLAFPINLIVVVAHILISNGAWQALGT